MRVADAHVVRQATNEGVRVVRVGGEDQDTHDCDRLSGRNFDHEQYFHLVLRIDSGQARAWSDSEVVERYGRLFRRPAESWDQLSPAQQADRVARWRARLADLSWFMRCLNESIARRANQEDDCTGCFWEGRFSFSTGRTSASIENN